MPARRKPGQRSMLLWMDEQDRERLEELHRLTGTPRTQLLLEALRLFHETKQPSVRDEVAGLKDRLAAVEKRLPPPAEE